MNSLKRAEHFWEHVINMQMLAMEDRPWVNPISSQQAEKGFMWGYVALGDFLYKW